MAAAAGDASFYSKRCCLRRAAALSLSYRPGMPKHKRSAGCDREIGTAAAALTKLPALFFRLPVCLIGLLDLLVAFRLEQHRRGFKPFLVARDTRARPAAHSRPPLSVDRRGSRTCQAMSHIFPCPLSPPPTTTNTAPFRRSILSGPPDHFRGRPPVVPSPPPHKHLAPHQARSTEQEPQQE